MEFFTPFNFATLCQFYYSTSPVLFTKLQYETIEWEKRNFFAYRAASAYPVKKSKVKNHIFRHNWVFKHICSINNPYWQSSEIITFLCKYYIVISDTLVRFFGCVLVARCNVIRASWKQRNKDWVTEKIT